MTILTRIGPFLVLVAAMLWATDAPFRVHLAQELSSGFIVLGEHLVSVLIVLPLLIVGWRALRRLSWKEWLAVLAIAIGGSALATIAFTEAFHYVNPSVAILLQKLQPLVAIGLASVFLREPLTRRFWIFALVALLGAYLITFPGLVPQTYPGETVNLHMIGVLFALTAALLWGASTVLGRFVLGTLDFKLVTALRFAVAFVFLFALAASQGTLSEVATLTSTDILFLIVIALVSGVVSLFIYYKGLSQTRASVATIAELGFPLAAVVVNWIFLDATLTPVQLIGAALLVLSVFWLSKENQRLA